MQCSILKSSTHVKCHFGRQKSFHFLFFWALHKNAFYKVSTNQSEGLSQNCLSQNTMATICYKNIVGLQFWHSSIHFQIPINPTISTLHLRLVFDYNFGLASTTICEHGFSKQNWVKSDHKSRLKVLETLDALMQASLCSLLMGNMDWARIFDT